MEEAPKLDIGEPNRIKAKTYEEFLIQLGIKKESELINWNPKIKNEPLMRSQSFICTEYTKPACYRTKPKSVIASAWSCDSQATRQLTMISRYGPKRYYFNNQNIHNIGQAYLIMEEAPKLDIGEPNRIKAKTYEEFLIQLGIKKESELINWNPKIKNEPLMRSQSFICTEYTKPACYRTKPKSVIASAWSCDSQATRQLTMISRYGPRRYYFNNQNIHNIGQAYLMGETTQTLGLCCTPRSVGSL